VTLKPILLPLGLSGSQLHAKIGLDCWYWRPYPSERQLWKWWL